MMQMIFLVYSMQNSFDLERILRMVYLIYVCFDETLVIKNRWKCTGNSNQMVASGWFRPTIVKQWISAKRYPFDLENFQLSRYNS